MANPATKFNTFCSVVTIVIGVYQKDWPYAMLALSALFGWGCLWIEQNKNS